MASLERQQQQQSKIKPEYLLYTLMTMTMSMHPDPLWKSSQGGSLPELYLFTDLLLSLEGILTLGIFATEETSITNITA